MTPDQHRKAKTVVAWLAKAENPEADEYPIDRVRAERWSEVCAAVEADPDLSAAAIAERLGPKSAEVGAARQRETSHRLATVPTSASPAHEAGHPQPLEWRPATAEERETARRRLAEIKAGLKEAK